MSQARGLREVGYFDCPGGGQVVVDGDIACIAHMHAPHGTTLVDVSDPARPRRLAEVTIPDGVHSHKVRLVHGVMLVNREVVHVAKTAPSPPAFLWLVDITDEHHPVPFASFQVEGIDGTPQPPFTGCHQPCEEVRGTEIPVAWFALGLRIVDVANLHAPREVASFLPDPPPGFDRVCANDVCYDRRGLMYVIDRQRGLHIVEWV